MELVPGKLYFYLDTVWRENTSGGRLTGDLIVSLDNSQKHVKSSKHFGPPLLKTIFEHCNRVDSTRKSGRVYFLTNDKEDNLHTEQRTISAFLMAAYAILRLNWDVNTTNDSLLASIPKKLAFFRDYHGDSNFKLNILDCLRGLYIGCKINQWFLTKNSSVASKIYDMDWIVPNKLLALRDPTIRRETRRRSVSKVAVREMRRCGITTIIRLNGQDHTHCLDYYGYSYEVDDIRKEQFLHYDIPFEDVNIPTLQQVNQFISFCEVSNGRLAVHCHAGLGRSAAMIGCYMIKHHGFDGRSACAWMKMCRSGSVMGPQHFFFERYEQYLKITQDTVLTIKDSTRLDAADIMEKVKNEHAAGRQICRAPRKNNIIHIVPHNKRNVKKISQPVKAETSKEVKLTTGPPTRNKRSSPVATPKRTQSPSGKCESDKKPEKRTTRNSTTPKPKLISSVMRTPAATPPFPKQSRKENSLKAYKIPTCYVKMAPEVDDNAGYKKRADKPRGAPPTKGPSYMKGTLSKSYETLTTVSPKTPVNINSSSSWSQRSGNQQPQAHNGVTTRGMKKHYDTFGVYLRR